MVEIKLNKNQKAFFEESIAHFGDASKAVKFATLTAFAETHGLTVPTTILKNYCSVRRGIYDLTKAGIEIKQETGLFALTDEVPEDDVDVFEFENNQPSDVDQPEVIETSVYANNIKSGSVPDIFKTREPIKTRWKNPVYVITDVDGDVRFVRDNPTSAYKACDRILHGTHSMTERQAIDALKKYGVVQIVCTTATSLRAIITIFDLNE